MQYITTVLFSFRVDHVYEDLLCFDFSLYRQGTDVGERDTMVMRRPHLSHADPKGGIILKSFPEVHTLPNSRNC